MQLLNIQLHFEHTVCRHITINNNIIVNIIFKEIQFDNVFNFKTKTRLDNNRYN